MSGSNALQGRESQSGGGASGVVGSRSCTCAANELQPAHALEPELEAPGAEPEPPASEPEPPGSEPEPPAHQEPPATGSSTAPVPCSSVFRVAAAGRRVRPLREWELAGERWQLQFRLAQMVEIVARARPPCEQAERDLDELLQEFGGGLAGVPAERLEVLHARIERIGRAIWVRLMPDESDESDASD